MKRVGHLDDAEQPPSSMSKRGASSSSKQSMVQGSNNCLAPSDADRRGLPSFAQWQARQLSSRDIVFAVFVLFMYLLYLRKTVPAVCSNVPMNSQQRVMGGHYRQQLWPTLWQLICGQPEQTSTAFGSWFKAATMSLFKAVVTFTGVGVLSGDPLHIFIPPLRIFLLLLVLVPLPYISLEGVWLTISARIGRSDSTTSNRDGGSSSSRRIVRWYDPNIYWRHPMFRNVIIMLQRISPSAIGAGCLLLNVCGVGWYSLVQKASLWRLVGKYSFQGWVAWLAVLPLRLHIVFNIIEWVINYIFYSNILDADGNVAGYFEVDRLLISFLCVVVLPSVAVMWLERGQRKTYQQLQQAFEATSATAEQAVNKGTSSSSRRNSWAKQQQQLQQHVAGSSKPPGTQGSMTEVTSCNVHCNVASNKNNRNNHNSSSSSSSSLSDLLPVLESLLGGSTARAVAAAAAAAAAGDAFPVGGAHALQRASGYDSTTQCLPISIKVHPSRCHHHPLSVSSVGPVLTSALHYQLSPFNTAAAPLAITTACFQGCVQLIANVMGLKRQLSSDPQSNSMNSDDSSDDSSDRVLLHNGSSKSLAAALLARVVDGVRLVANAAGATASSADSITSSSLAVVPEVDVAVGSMSVSTCSERADATISSAGPPFVLQSVDPVCLVADQDQQIRLSLSLSGPQQHQQQQPGCQDAASSGPDDVRLLVLRECDVIVDEDVKLRQQISVKLPAQASGVLTLALLPGRKPAAAAATGDRDGDREETTPANSAGTAELVAPVAAAAPLLLLPLLVLPAAATEEVCRYYQHLTAAAAADDDASDASSSRAWQSICALTTDVAYLLSASAAAHKAATAAAASSKGGVCKQQLPAGLQAVLKHLLVHLAACGMFQVMTHVVEVAAAVFVAADSEAAGCNRAITAAQQGGGVGDDVTSAATCSSSIKATAGKLQAITDVTRQQDGKSKSAISTNRIDSISSDGSSSSSSINGTPVSASELLWGFRDPSLEARYQAAAFSSSGWLDLFSFMYVAVFSVGFFLRQQGSSSLIKTLDLQWAETTSPATPAAAAASTWDATFSDMLFTLAYLSGPLPVLLLRLRVARQLLQLQQHQQQRDTTAVLIHAAGVKQGFMLLWMATAPVLTGLFAVSEVLVTPSWIIKAWGQRGLAQDLGSVFAMCLKGFTGQVPYSFFWPIMAVQILLAAVGSAKFGMQPRYGIVVRYIPALALTLVVNARQQIQGRRRFCAGHGIAIAN